MDYSNLINLSLLPNLSQHSYMLLRRVVAPQVIVDKSLKCNKGIQKVKGSSFVFANTCGRTKTTTYDLCYDHQLYNLSKYYRIKVNGIEFTKFGPSSSLMSNDLIKKWTDEQGLPHRSNAQPAIIHLDVEGKKILRKEFWEHGVKNNKVGPTIVDFGSNYEKFRNRNFSFDVNESPENKLNAFKIHFLDGKINRTNPYKPTEVHIGNGLVTFNFGKERDFLSLNFNIVPDDEIREHSIKISDVEKMIEEFGDVDSDGNDLSDKYVN